MGGHPPPSCGDGVVGGGEVCDPAAPASACCAQDCSAAAAADTQCGPDPDGAGCEAPPACDGTGVAPEHCVARTEPGGAPCTDDGLFCTGTEACQGGVCTSGGDPCPGPDGDDDCKESCNEQSDSCTAGDAYGSACGSAKACSAGLCLGGKHLWSKRFGDASGQYGWAVAADDAGDLLLAGAFYGTIDFGGGVLDSVGLGGRPGFLAKLDGAGNHIWSKRFAGTGDVSPVAASCDKEASVVVAGFFWGGVDFGGGVLANAGFGTSDVFLAKFGAAGNHIWSKRFGDALGNQAATAVAYDGQGNVLVAGQHDGAVDFGGGELDGTGAFLAKFDPAGNHLWSKSFGISCNCYARGVAGDGAGNVVVVGEFQGTVDFGAGVLASVDGGKDGFVGKYDAAGNHAWSKHFGNEYGAAIHAVAVEGEGSVLLVGDFSGEVDFGGGVLGSKGNQGDVVVAKYDKAGKHLWAKCFGDASSQSARAVAVDSSNNVILSGRLTGGTIDFGGGPLTSAGGSDVFLAKLDPQGNHLWSKRFGDDQHQIDSSVAADAEGNAFIAGPFRGTVDFGGGPLMSAGFEDVFAAKFGP
ncbi:MAG: hypothetical protein HY744_17135 [Deltaproteobacteria bacterium]|nr:hypothetical protein [Deltaproteobacteria bacterium]